MKTVEKDIKGKLISAAKKCQQNFYELLSDWNSYDQKRHQCLKNFIGIALFGPPKIGDLIANRSFSSGKNWEDEILYYDPHQQKKIHNIYEKILRHGIQNTPKQEIMCGIIYNVTFDMKSMEALKKILEAGKGFSDENISKCLQYIPIFKVLKNDVKIKNGKKITRKFVYYIDHCERVYKNWNDYLRSNFLPECIMVLPKKGEYQGDDKKQWAEKISYVWIEIHESPACKTKIINTINSLNNFVSLGCAGIGVAAVSNPVGVTFVALSAIGMGLSGLWSIGKSSHEFADRHLHEQSLSINDKDGFSRWFGVASSALSVFSSGGSMLLSQAIRNGTPLSTVAKVAHGSIQIGSVVANGVNVGLAGCNIYESQLERKVSAQDVLNLIASLLLFSNSAVDFQLSSNIIERNQTHFIRDFEDSLRSCRHRKEFRRMVRNSTSIMSSSNGSREQIIRCIAKISHKDLFTTSIISNQRNFSLKGIEVSSSDGSITIDGKSLMRPADFVKKVKKKANGIQPVAVALTTNFGSHDIIFEKVLKDFSARYRKELQDLKPALNQFSPFLNDVRNFEKADVIFAKILLISIKLVRRITNKRNSVNNILAEIVDFLWEFMQANFKERISPRSKSEVYRESLMKIVIGVHTSVEHNLDDWIDSFKDYLIIKFKMIREKVANNKKERMYLLHVL